MSLLTFDPISIDELVQFAEVTEDVLLAFRARDEAAITPPLRQPTSGASNSTSTWATLDSFPSVWIPSWCTQAGVILYGGTSDASETNLAQFRLRINGVDGNIVEAGYVGSSGNRVEATFDMTSEPGNYYAIDVRGRTALTSPGATAYLVAGEMVLSFRRT